MELENIKIIALFFEGILSFFSPCILPIIPIYISILASENNNKLSTNKKHNVIINSIFFILGISLTFFILAFATSYISTFLYKHTKIIKIISGIIIIIMGLIQLEFLNFSFLKKEFSFKNKFKNKKINPLILLTMGFTFSFSWTPCIGPILASVFLYANTHTGIDGIIFIIVYALGFILPFFIISLFSNILLNKIKKYYHILNYTMKISGIILIIIGISILTGSFQNFILKYLF